MILSPSEPRTRTRAAGASARRPAAGLLSLLLLAGAPLLGQEVTPLRLTVEAALRVAETESQETAIAASKILVSASDIRVARSALLPQVDAQLQYMRTIRTPFVMPNIPGTEITLPFGNANTWNGGFDFSQLLYDGGRARATQKVAEESDHATRLDAVETTASVRVAVVEAYFGAVLAERQAQIAILTAEQLSNQLDTVELRRKAGEASDLDVFRANVEKENVEPQRIAALNDRDLALGHLRQLLNLPAGKPLLLEDDLTAGRIRPLPREKVDAIRGSAPKRSNLEASLHLVSSRDLDAKSAHAAVLPTVKLTAHFGGYAFPATTFPSSSNFMDDWSVTVNASVGKVSGAVGAYNNIDPRVEDIVCEELGIGREPISNQVVQRDRHAAFLGCIAIVGSGIEKFATEIRHLQRTEVREAEEAFGKGQKGSSAMPHKRNPILSERMAGCARVLRGNAMVGLENVALWHERDISHSSAERIVFPDSCILLDYMLQKFTKLMDGLVVDEERMLANLGQSYRLVFSGAVLLALVDKGMLRDDAYRVVQDAAMAAWRDGVDFGELIKRSDEAMAVMSPQDVDAAMDPAQYTAGRDVIFGRLEKLEF